MSEHANREARLYDRAARLGITLIPPHEGWLLVDKSADPGWTTHASLDELEERIAANEEGNTTMTEPNPPGPQPYSQPWEQRPGPGYPPQPGYRQPPTVLDLIAARAVRIPHLAHVIACIDDDQERSHGILRNASAALQVLVEYLEQGRHAAFTHDEPPGDGPDPYNGVTKLPYRPSWTRG